jgi:predicted dehydrogenase
MPKYLVIGQGSMGKRRVRCLLAGGVASDEIVVFDTRADRLDESRAKHGVGVTDDYESYLADPNVTAVFVSVPGSLHMRFCAAAALAGKHWFCEVPLATSLEGLDALKATTRERSLIGAPGCQVLFHPLGLALKRWAEDPTTGPILAGSYAIGTYLPDWHPYEDYRKFYAADAAQGGGNLDVIAQDVTWIRWIIDRRIEAVTCRSSNVSDLELAAGTPDHYEMILEFAGGLMLSMHTDLVDRTHERLLRLATITSTAKWSTLEHGLRVFDSSQHKWHEIAQPEGYDYERCYHAEIKQFLTCIATGEPWPIGIEAAEEVVRVLLALKESSESGRTVGLA